jgi:phage terminase small subunit
MRGKRDRFVEEYLVDLNATQAAIRAGYSEKTARSQGQRLLTKVDIQAAIQIAEQERSERTEIDQDRVLREQARIGFSDIRQLFDERGNLKPIQALPDDVAAAISSIEVVAKNTGKDSEGNPRVEYVYRIRLWDKRGALSDISKHLGMFVERHEIASRGGEPIKSSEEETIRLARRAAYLLAKADNALKNGKGNGGTHAS